MDTQATSLRPAYAKGQGSASMFSAALPFLVLLVVGLAFPLFGGGYWGVIATRACVYWVLVSGLNLVVGFGGQIAIGWVALLTLGAYTTSVLVAGNATPALPPYLALAIAAVVGAVFGLIVGLPALRLRTFYFAITTLGFATIVTQVALAWQSVTGGGVGVAGPVFPPPFNSQWGFYYFCFGLAAICTWMTANIAASRFGRALTAIRDAEVAAEASGIAKPALLGTVFLFSGAVAGVAGGLFASLQSYITPDAFTLDLSILFFIAILIGGRGSILGPLLGTVLLTVLPEFAAPLVAWSTFLYAVLLLVIVLAMPGGIAEILDFRNRRPLESGRAILPRPELLGSLLGTPADAGALTLGEVALSFGGVKAIDGLDLEIRPGQVHGLIGPNGSGKTTTLNVISGYYAPQRGAVRLNGVAMPALVRHRRAHLRIARTFQTPRIVGSASVLENVMIGGTIDGEGTFVESLLSLPRHRRDEARLHDTAMLALATVGLEQLASVRADRLQHSELRFTEIARALMLRPAFLLLDEPAAGLSAEEIERLGALILAIARAGTGVLGGGTSPRPDLRHLPSRHRAQSRQDPGGGNAGRNPRASGGGQCLSRRLIRCSTSPTLQPATARSACCAASASPSARARWWRCSGPTAPARPRCCARCRDFCRGRDGCISAAAISQASVRATPSRRGSRMSSRDIACSRSSACSIISCSRSTTCRATSAHRVSRRRWRCSPRSPPSATNAPRRSPAASSKFWRWRRGWSAGQDC